jgi:hypothetical protein
MSNLIDESSEYMQQLPALQFGPSDNIIVAASIATDHG